jgi:signal transduction histidine kinase
MHDLLERQLHRHWGDPARLPGEWRAFVAAVDAAYREVDEDRALREHAMDVMLTELTERNRRLQQEKTEQETLIAQLAQTREQLVQSEKLASIGQLAAGVAHEINNPVGFASSNLRTLRDYAADLCAIVDAYAARHPSPEDGDALRRAKDYDFIRADIVQLLAETQDGLARVARIVGDLRNFSHPGESAWQEADLNRELDASVRMAGIAETDACRIIRDYGALPRIRCVPAELNRVFINLLSNALHAIDARGEITLRTRHLDNRIGVAIADNGCGIPAESLNRIFDPFFTTKPIGQGTGLGLALAHGIVAKHGGRIDVSSVPGQGATFTVWLPLSPPGDTTTSVP